ncbi:MAG: hypothetical protein LIR50_16140 [Bacillota bacterium]|nr:hypothetical protein [Bacillota bacterium]
MITAEKTIEVRGMRRMKIINYFMGIGGEKTDQGEFIMNGWKVDVGEENTINVGKLNLYSTKVTFQCGQSMIDKKIHDFRLKFLLAGGQSIDYLA